MNHFIELGIRDDILKGLETLGFDTPTPVQTKVIPLIFEKQDDLVSLAQTGTGKTAAFGIPLIQLTDISSKKIQSLILCPTRELCVQVAKDLTAFAAHVPGIKILAVYGGARIDTQINSLKHGVQIIVATPGRLNDLINRGHVDASSVRSVVLDEADEMLQMGFQDELNAILDLTPTDKRTLLFSATMPKSVAAISRRYMKNPVEITIGQRNCGAENVQHIYYVVQARDRYPALKRLIDINPDMYSIIFCRTRQETREIAEKLVEDGYGADALHGDLSQSQRDSVMNKFRRRTLQLLIATDVAARGLDVNDLTHVINYNLPDDNANYTHRSGRTGRAGKTGISVSIIHLREKFRIRELEKNLQKKFQQNRIPGGAEICEKQLLGLVNTLKQVDINSGQIEPFFSAIVEELAPYDREELIKRFLSLEFNRFLQYYRDAPDLNVPDRKSERPTKNTMDAPRGRQPKFTRFLLNVGKKDGIHPGRLIGEINDMTGVPRVKIGKIEIMHNSAFLEAETKFAPQILGVFEHMMINGKPVSIQVSRDRAVSYTADRNRKGRNTPKHPRKKFRRK